MVSVTLRVRKPDLIILDSAIDAIDGILGIYLAMNDRAILWTVRRVIRPIGAWQYRMARYTYSLARSLDGTLPKAQIRQGFIGPRF